MFYTIYKVLNKLSGKHYIGMHKTKNLNDGYMGSGKLIKRAIAKHGIENFTKEILYTYDNEQDMKNKERELVIVSEETYNLCEGGKGGFGYINKNKLNIYENHGILAAKNARETIKNKRLDDPEYNKKYLEKQKRLSNLGTQVQKEKYPNGVWFGKSHSEDTKQKMRKSKNVGNNNSQFGSMWITNGSDNKKIKKDVDFIPEGWYKGRVI